MLAREVVSHDDGGGRTVDYVAVPSPRVKSRFRPREDCSLKERMAKLRATHVLSKAGFTTEEIALATGVTIRRVQQRFNRLRAMREACGGV
jgi:DNA-directed RNA polymerase specialized sigma24 family protein